MNKNSTCTFFLFQTSTFFLWLLEKSTKFNFHYFLAALKNYNKLQKLQKKKKKHLSESSSFMPVRQTDTCPPVSSHRPSSLSSCSHETPSTHSWGLNGEFFLQNARGFIVLFLSYCMQSKFKHTATYNVLNLCRLPQQYRSACRPPKARLDSPSRSGQKGDFNKKIRISHVRSEV